MRSALIIAGALWGGSRLALSQGADDLETLHQRLAQSEERWSALKQVHGESYTYVATATLEEVLIAMTHHEEVLV